MPAPYNYTFNVKDPRESMVNTINTIQGVRDIALKNQQYQMAMERQKQLSQMIASLQENPTVESYAAVANMLPKDEADSLRSSFSMLDKAKQERKLAEAGKLISALRSSPKVAIDMLSETAQGYRNSGNNDQANLYDAWAKLADLSPDTVADAMGVMMAAVPGGDKVLSSVISVSKEGRDRELQPYELIKSKAESIKSKVDAEFAESNAVLDLQKKGIDIEKVTSDIEIAKQNAKIAAMTAKLQAEENELKRKELELKISDAKEQRDQQLRDKTSIIENAATQTSIGLNAIDKLLANPSLDDVIGSIEGSESGLSGLIGSAMTAFDDQEQDAIALIDQLSAATFVEGVKQFKQSGGAGALSDSEGRKLGGLVASLNRRQGAKQFRQTLSEIKVLLDKSAQNLADKYNMTLPTYDTPNADVNVDVDSVIRDVNEKFRTRSQVRNQ